MVSVRSCRAHRHRACPFRSGEPPEAQPWHCHKRQRPLTVRRPNTKSRATARTFEIPTKLSRRKSMGLLSRLTSSVTPTKKATDDVLLLHTMMLMCGADGGFDDSEVETLEAFFATLPEFQG